MTPPADAAAPPAAPCPPVLRGLRAAVGPELLGRIRDCRILLVGAGGIGCELLKNLALSGFRRVDVIDLDTIDVSNLNRQFLFRSAHVGMAKCVVASAAALRMVPPSDDAAFPLAPSYTPHHGNVCDSARFHVPYIKTFALVLNALDNVAARRHVNRLCLAAGVPLVEAGTAGYLGQATVIDRAAGTECYECQAKPAQKVYPICTIRSTPSQPVHCIVWAKELHKLCFGARVEDSMLFEDEASLRAGSEEGNEGGGSDQAKEGDGDRAEEGDGGDAEEGDKGDRAQEGDGGERSTYMAAVGELRALLGVAAPADAAPRDDGALRAKAHEVLAALFDAEIRKQIGMDRYKTAAAQPVPVAPEDLAACTDSGAVPPTARAGCRPTDVWSPGDCVAEIAACFVEVAASAAPRPLPAFDKDDGVAMRFVAAAANLRASVFAIAPLQSLYGAKGIAGNIIPAIATTNAVVAGLQVLQAFHVLRGQAEAAAAPEGEDRAAVAGRAVRERCRYVYCLRDKTRKGYLLQPTALPPPNPACFVCRNATLSLALNTREWTLGMLLARVVKKELGFVQPTVLLGEDSLVYEEGEDIDPAEYKSNLSKRLCDLPAGGVGHGTSVRVEDFTQDLEVEVSVSHRERWPAKQGPGGPEEGEPREDDREESEKFEIGGEKPVAAATEEGQGAAAAGASDGTGAAEAPTGDDDSDGDDIEIVEEEEASKEDSKRPAEDGNGANTATAKKRRLDGGEPPAANGNGAKKKAKVSDEARGSAGEGAIELE